MAVMHAHASARTVRSLLRYLEAPGKTEDGLFTSSFGCRTDTAAEEITSTLARYEKESAPHLTHIIQSFMPGECDPVTAHLFARDFVMEALPFREAVIATHINGTYIHNHIAVNPVNLLTGQIYPEWTRIQRELPEHFQSACRRYGFSFETGVSKAESRSYPVRIMQSEGLLSPKEKLESDIEACLSMSLDLDNFFDLMGYRGYTIHRSGPVPLFQMEGFSKAYPYKLSGKAQTEKDLFNTISEGLLSDDPGPALPLPHTIPKRVWDLGTLYRVVIEELTAIGSGGVTEADLCYRDTNHLRQYRTHLSFLERNGIRSHKDLIKTEAVLSGKVKELRRASHRLCHQRYKRKALFSALDTLDAYSLPPMPRETLLVQDKTYQSAVQILGKRDIGALRKKRTEIAEELSRIRKEAHQIRKELSICRAVQKIYPKVNAKLGFPFPEPEREIPKSEEIYANQKRTDRQDHERS